MVPVMAEIHRNEENTTWGRGGGDAEQVTLNGIGNEEADTRQGLFAGPAGSWDLAGRPDLSRAA